MSNSIIKIFKVNFEVILGNLSFSKQILSTAEMNVVPPDLFLSEFVSYWAVAAIKLFKVHSSKVSVSWCIYMYECKKEAELLNWF